MNQFKIKFIKSGRGKAQCSPDPDFPNGKNIIMNDCLNCVVDLPYPAPECGVFIVRCTLCNIQCGIIAAGRPDDPRKISIPCRFPYSKVSSN